MLSSIFSFNYLTEFLIVLILNERVQIQSSISLFPIINFICKYNYIKKAQYIFIKDTKKKAFK